MAKPTSPPVKSQTTALLPLTTEDQHRWRYDNLGRLLLVAFTDWEKRLLATLQANGFTQLKLVHLSCLRHLDFDGTRIVDLAKRANMTKAGMGQLVGQCEHLGFVAVGDHPIDARAKWVQFTPLGWSIIEANRRAIETTENTLKAQLGQAHFEAIYSGLMALRDQLEPAESAAAHGIKSSEMP
jgi:DNA-binding MarR family transcriptional regulator